MNQDNRDDTQSFGMITPGSEINQYVIVEKIGSGGMGDVYLADDTHLRRQVALKFLSKNLSNNDEFRQRFTREARTAAALNHPSIVTIHDVSEFSGQPFIAMEYIEGKSLKEIARLRKLDFPAIHKIAAQLASGLDLAHQKGIVHRDIKSDNVIIDNRGNAHILDFGLARGGREQNLTQTGTTLGTIAYMSPEQAEGKTVDGRSDLFSLGVVLYEAISGSLPFRGEHVGAVINAILNLSPEPLNSEARALAPPPFIEHLLRLLEKDPARRFQTAAEFLDAIAEFGGISTLYRTSRNAGRKRIGVFAVAGVIALILIGNLFLRHSEVSEDELTMVAVLPFENLGLEEDRYFAVGIGDEINTQLSKLNGLGVISRSSVARYDAETSDLGQVGKDLGVQYVLQGRILWDRTVTPVRVKISAALSSTSRGVELWADSYDEVLNDIFAVQEDIARKVSHALDITLAKSEEKSLHNAPTNDVEAFTYYLQGNDYLNHAQWDIAIEMYQKAVLIDSTFALAFANMSRAHSLMYWHYLDRSSERLALAEATAMRALHLDPDLPEAHLALGRFYYRGKLDYARALKEYNKALELQPGNSDLLFAVGSVKRRQGLWQESIDYFKRAVNLDPRSTSKLTNLGDTFGLMRKFEQAYETYERLKSLAPDNPVSYSKLFTLILRWKGDIAQARAELERAPAAVSGSLLDDFITVEALTNNSDSAIVLQRSLRLTSVFTEDSSYYYLRLGELLLGGGRGDEATLVFDSARVILEELVTQDPQEPQYHSLLAVAEAGSGYKEKAVAEGQTSINLCPITADALSGSNWLYNLMLTYIMIGDFDSARKTLIVLLDIPSVVTGSYIEINPIFRDFLNHADVQRLVEEPL